MYCVKSATSGQIFENDLVSESDMVTEASNLSYEKALKLAKEIEAKGAGRSRRLAWVIHY